MSKLAEKLIRMFGEERPSKEWSVYVEICNEQTRHGVAVASNNWTDPDGDGEKLPLVNQPVPRGPAS